MMITPKVAQLLFSVRLCSQGWFFVRWGLLVTAVLYAVGVKPLVWLSLVGTLVIAGFFRDPHRITLDIPDALISPADGVVMEVSREDPPEELDLPKGDWQKIGIFLAPWHVHINRVPVGGTVDKKVYKKGKFSHVATQGSQIDNERLSLVIQRPSGDSIACVQIAGFLARRIITTVDVGDKLDAGQRYGLICFGSRVDLYFPNHFAILVAEGQRMIGGETVLALDQSVLKRDLRVLSEEGKE
jgi:phosphatidylserine decarboxylase